MLRSGIVNAVDLEASFEPLTKAGLINASLRLLVAVEEVEFKSLASFPSAAKFVTVTG